MNIRRKIAAAAAVATAAGFGGMAEANAVTASTTQVVTGTVVDSVSVSVSKATVPFGNLGVGANVIPTATAGTMTVSANIGYSVTVLGLKAKMTKYTTLYDDTVTMASPLLMTTTSASTGAVPVAAATIGNDATAPSVVATGVLGTHTYDLSFAQTVAPADAHTTYRNDLTYTVTSTV